MKLERFGSAISVREQRVLRTWFIYAMSSTLALLLCIGYLQITTLLEWYTLRQKNSSLVADQALLTQALQEKTKLKKEIDVLKIKERELTRINRQIYNPYRLLQGLQGLKEASVVVQSISCQQEKIELVLIVPHKQMIDVLIKQLSQTDSMYTFEIGAMQTVEQGVQVTLVGRF